MELCEISLQLWVLFVLLGLCFVFVSEAAVETDCWMEGYSAEKCCGLNPVRTDCFDVIYTEELCCGTSYQSSGSAIDESICRCSSSSAEDFIEMASSNIPPKQKMPSLGTSEVICSKWLDLENAVVDDLQANIDACPLARVLGCAICAHAKAEMAELAEASIFADCAAMAAKAVARRKSPYCREGMKRLVDRSFPFSEAETARNAERIRYMLSSEWNESSRPNDKTGWKRDWKPQLGSRSVLDDIVLKYRASQSMRAWQKQFGCSGGDTGQDGNFYSQLYQRIFDHHAVGSASMGPSRHNPTRVLEVGVCDGSGVAVWAEYFYHPESRIVAVDIDIKLFGGNRPYLHQRGFDLSRLDAIIEANVANLSQEARMIVGWGLDSETTSLSVGISAILQRGPYDFIRDDASHVASDMIAAFEALFTTVLRPCGVYVIEDVWSYPYEKDTGKSLDASGEYSYFFKLARDATNMGWRYDGETFDGFRGTAWIQSPLATPLEAWVDYVQFGHGWILIRKRCE